ncbi:hypothetical protein ACUXK4_003973 [Methylorubrum extorquens]
MRALRPLGHGGLHRCRAICRTGGGWLVVRTSPSGPSSNSFAWIRKATACAAHEFRKGGFFGCPFADHFTGGAAQCLEASPHTSACTCRCKCRCTCRSTCRASACRCTASGCRCSANGHTLHYITEHNRTRRKRREEVIAIGPTAVLKRMVSFRTATGVADSTRVPAIHRRALASFLAHLEVVSGNEGCCAAVEHPADMQCMAVRDASPCGVERQQLCRLALSALKRRTDG